MTERYRPSNATEGDAFFARFCNRCRKQEGCEIPALTMRHRADAPEYPSEWILDSNEGSCSAFEPMVPQQPSLLGSIAAGNFTPTGRKRYRTILADPPWLEQGGGKVKRGADRHYPLMPTREIIALGLGLELLIDPIGCHLWLWVTGNFLPDGLAVMAAWGFRYVNYRPWIKGEESEDGEIEMQNAGLGQYLRGDSELMLFGVRGSLPYRYREDGKRAQCRQTLIAPRTIEHSQKPDKSYQDIELVSHAPRLEMFARQPRPGWDLFGNEVQSDVQIVSAGQLSLLGGG